MDRRTPINEEFVNRIMQFTVFAWEGRSPSPALDDDGNFVGTDLDLFSFLVPLAERGAIIEIPEYENRRQVIKKAGERRIGKSRFGNITGLISNKEVFSFNVRIWDQSVIAKDPETGRERSGAHRNFMLVDVDGYWYDGWHSITWDPTAKENAFLTENRLFKGDTVTFTHYVHPCRWQSVFGAPYLLLKMLHARLTDEGKFYRDEVKRLERLGIAVPPGEIAPYEKPVSKGATKMINVETMEMELDLPGFSGSYASVPETPEGARTAYRRQKLLTYSLRPRMQFAMRADEAAYFRHGAGRIASWMGNCRWRTQNLGRSGIWNALGLSGAASLRWRLNEMKQTVAA